MNARAAELEHAPPREPKEQFDDLGQQHETAQLGMWIFLATEILFFGVLFAGYTIGRIRDPQGFVIGSKHTELLYGAVESAILLFSSAAVTWAVILIEQVEPPGGNQHHDVRSLVTGLLGFAMLCGVAFIVLHGVEYKHEYDEHLMPGIDYAQHGPFAKQMELFFFVYYALTLFHTLHVLIGTVLLAVMAMLVRRGTIHCRYSTPLVVGGLYWHLVDIVWIFLFPLIYLVDRT
ncbi:MAG: cytochrome c oxidase subunit 3 [Rhodanobacteraceae bacterium]